ITDYPNVSHQKSTGDNIGEGGRNIHFTKETHKQQIFVLFHYVIIGVEELDQVKLSPPFFA
ncbi:MAG: hypothetical protein WCR46_25410, partial [Deltaproteobacteria bacterium]